jgi:hypothetical protein
MLYCIYIHIKCVCVCMCVSVCVCVCVSPLSLFCLILSLVVPCVTAAMPVSCEKPREKAVLRRGWGVDPRV